MYRIALKCIALSNRSTNAQFAEKPVSTSIDYNKLEFRFPDVTICSLIPFSYYTLGYHKLYDAFMNTSDEEDRERLYKEVCSVKSSLCSLLYNLLCLI